MPDVFCLIHTRFHLNEIGDSPIQQLDSYTLDPIIDLIIDYFILLIYEKIGSVF